MTPIPWPLIGRPRATAGAVTPAPARGPAAAKDAAPPKPPKPPGAPLWLISEARVLDRFADAGGDLTAHRTVHLETR